MSAERNDLRRIALLNGDCLAEQLKGAELPLERIIFREALVSGPLGGASWGEFWETRVGFLTQNYGATVHEVQEKTVAELEKIRSLADGVELSLWFEDDLFCQVNLWFILSLLAEKHKYRLFRVFPPGSTRANQWKGFGAAAVSSLEEAYRARVPFYPSDVAIGNGLWKAYRSQDWALFKNLSYLVSPCFNSLEEVCQAQLDRLPGSDGLGKPEQILKGILAGGTTDFPLVFKEFTRQAGIYGFGDLQVKALIASLLKGKD